MVQRASLIVVALALGAPTAARADGDLCARGVRHHGAPLDLDVKDADVQDVLRLLADTGDINLVISDEVRGRVTLRMKRVAWDQAACIIARTHHLSMSMQDNILLVRAATHAPARPGRKR